jgi:hypothetical protein
MEKRVYGPHRGGYRTPQTVERGVAQSRRALADRINKLDLVTTAATKATATA